MINNNTTTATTQVNSNLPVWLHLDVVAGDKAFARVQLGSKPVRVVLDVENLAEKQTTEMMKSSNNIEQSTITLRTSFR